MYSGRLQQNQKLEGATKSCLLQDAQGSVTRIAWKAWEASSQSESQLKGANLKTFVKYTTGCLYIIIIQKYMFDAGYKV
jgi:nitrogen-specific signal transduction histidine kinase